jgi:hypothetical protein
MYQLEPQPNERSGFLDKLRLSTRWSLFLIGVLFTGFVLIGIFIMAPGSFAEQPASPAAESAEPHALILIPTATPPSSEPTATATPEAPMQMNGSDYPSRFMVAMRALSPSVVTTTNLLAHPEYGDAQWTTALQRELDLIDEVSNNITGLIPPAQYRETHLVFRFAVTRCQEASQYFRLAIANNDQSQVRSGVALLTSCTEHLTMASRILKLAQ